MNSVQNPTPNQHSDDSLVGGPLLVDGTYNFRAVLAGTEAYNQLNPGLLYRSDDLSKLSQAGQEALAQLGVSTVVDLRDEHEIKQAPNQIADLEIESFHTPVFEGLDPFRIFGEKKLSLNNLYLITLEQFATPLITAITQISNAPGAAVVHCTAGKDRTGLVVALTLSAIGIDSETVVADYQASERNLAGTWAEAMLTKAKQFIPEVSEEIKEIIIASPAAAMQETLEYLEANYGTVTEYLLAKGLSEETLELLKTKFLKAKLNNDIEL